MNEEKYLERNFGRDTHYRVPEGYFENFANRMMEQLPERQAVTIMMRPSRWLRWRPYVAAASICAVVFGSGLFLLNHEADQPVDETSLAVQSAAYSVEEAADYVMLDNDDLYSYLADYQ